MSTRLCFVPPAIYLGKREGKDLVYMGKVGTGWSECIKCA